MTLTEPEWLTLTEASRLLGVHPMTLRAWVNAGRVRAFRTPGGHRRFQLADLRAFLEQHRADAQIRALTVTSDQTLQHIRQQLSTGPVSRQSWYQRLTDAQRAKHRDIGQRLLGLLLQFVSRQENAEHFLAEGRTLARAYGRELARTHFTISELAQAFLFFRQMIVNAAYPPEGASAQGDAEGIRLLQRINTFMDELLLATLDAFEQVARKTTTPHRTRSPAKHLPEKSRKSVRK